MKRLALVLSVLVLAGCGPVYKVTPIDSRLSDSDSTLYVAEGNRISRKSMAGGGHIDHTGLQINPAVDVRPDGSIASLYLSLVNVTSAGTRFGSPNSIGTPRRIAFLADGDLITVNLLIGDVNHAGRINYDSLTRSASVDVRETGQGLIDPADFMRIVNAETLVVRVEGSRRSHTYEAGDIDASFRENLRKFAEQFAL